jgi:PAS domain S-box-containing protein
MQSDFYKDLFDNSNDLIQSVSPRGEILYVNNTWVKKLGYKKSELKNLNVFNIIHPCSLDHCKEAFTEIMSKEGSVNVKDVTFIKKNGDPTLLEGNVSSKFEDDKPVYTRGIFRDITDKVKTEQNLEILNHIT